MAARSPAFPVPGGHRALFETEYKRQLFRWAAERVRGEFRGTTWAAFWETGVEGKKAQVVAANLGMSIGAVYMAKSRVVARIRQVIEQVEGESTWTGIGEHAMVDRACECETDRLRRHVEGLLGEDEQELLAAHLDRCEHVPRFARGAGRRRPLMA